MAKGKKRNTLEKKSPWSGFGAAVLAVLICLLGILVYKNSTAEPIMDAGTPAPGQTDAAAPSPPPPVVTEEVVFPEPEETPEPEPTPEPLPEFSPGPVSGTEPSNLIIETAVEVNGEIVKEYVSEEHIDFGYGADYTGLEGIITFRGNNFRDSASFGFANLSKERFGSYWTKGTASLQAPDGAVWTGNGWTGQPLIVRWPKETRAVMKNMYDWARQQEELTEVIYAAMDGYVYFLEMDTGKATRDALYIGYTFKGAGSLDPRGYPLLYVGAGYDSNRGKSRAFIISLIDGSILYEFGNNDGFALRAWHMFDSAPLVDAETDQLIYPGESGILYIIKLNTQYDSQAGTVSVNPDRVVKWRYKGARTSRKYWLGMEASAVIWRGHIIMPDNGGNLMCLDLNTLELKWVQDVLDDTNCTPVLELENGHPYVYVSPSFHAGWRAYEGQTVAVPIFKIDAVTGEIVWQVDYKCHTVSGVSGGVQGSPALGKNGLSNLIFFPVARTPGASEGKLVALDKRTGEAVWEFKTLIYSWSSPVAIYNEEGKGYIVYCTSGGYIYLLDGLTGEVLDSRDLGGNIEASPAVFENTVVVGTRAQIIWGIKLD
jgi:outer membrane protein assembly factor BamB